MNPDPLDPLDQELRSLFADDRLAVPVREDADAVIVAGARRLRRRRVMLQTTAGVVAVLALVVGGAAIAGVGDSQPGEPVAAPPPAVTTTTPEATTTTTKSLPASEPEQSRSGTKTKQQPTPPRTRTSRPRPPATGTPEPMPTALVSFSGYGPLRLGMSTEEALATGQLTENGSGGAGCTSYLISGGGEVLISGSGGLVWIAAPAEAQTPEGVQAGVTVGQVRETYPDVSTHFAGDRLILSGGSSHYEFMISVAGQTMRDSDRLRQINLVSNSYDCG